MFHSHVLLQTRGRAHCLHDTAECSAPWEAIFVLFWEMTAKGHVQKPYKFLWDISMYAKMPIKYKSKSVGKSRGKAALTCHISGLHWRTRFLKI